jgi:hypothetical protein
MSYYGFFMGDSKTILSLISDIYITEHPSFFYKEVVYFPAGKKVGMPSPFISLSEIFIDQIDTKLVEEQSENNVGQSQACFFFKS